MILWAKNGTEKAEYHHRKATSFLPCNFIVSMQELYDLVGKKWYRTMF